MKTVKGALKLEGEVCDHMKSAITEAVRTFADAIRNYSEKRINDGCDFSVIRLTFTMWNDNEILDESDAEAYLRALVEVER